MFSSLNIDQNSKVHSQFWELRLNPTCDCINNSKKKKEEEFKTELHIPNNDIEYTFPFKNRENGNVVSKKK